MDINKKKSFIIIIILYDKLIWRYAKHQCNYEFNENSRLSCNFLDFTLNMPKFLIQVFENIIKRFIIIFINFIAILKCYIDQAIFLSK